MAQSAFDALFDLIVNRFAVRIDFQGPIVDGGAEGHATAAAVT
jgi:hypothetical protein